RFSRDWSSDVCSSDLPRQKRTPGGCASIAVRTVAPVVVRPEVASKKASVKEGKLPDQARGTAATREATTQPSPTVARASRGWRASAPTDREERSHRRRLQPGRPAPNAA